ncbi:MAG: NUDIX domain-containing protein [Chlorobi bacterium]|nr:NUDIX domain-containing protein [Chlorobiota bacterium]
MLISAGLVLLRKISNEWHLLLGHPGGPFYRKKHRHVWSIPKGLVEGDEDYIRVARRETFEETGLDVCGPFVPLPPVKYKSGKIVYVWATLGPPPEKLINPPPSSTFALEFPPGSGRIREFPEIDYIKYVSFTEARELLVKGQLGIIDFLESKDGLLVLEAISTWQAHHNETSCSPLFKQGL